MKRLFRNQNGATSIEYCMIASLIGLILVTAITSIGHSVNDDFTAVLAGFK
jgi:Flp pilus assembly pilin Flp